GDHEVPISRTFRTKLIQDKNAIRLPLLIDREVSEDDLLKGKELGRIDIRFIHGSREDVYLAFECKRLNVISSRGRRDSLAGKYVKEGMMRYVEGRYSRNLRTGGMIGYVMDGNAGSAISSVSRVVKRRHRDLSMNENAGLMKSSIKPHNPRIRETS